VLVEMVDFQAAEAVLVVHKQVTMATRALVVLVALEKYGYGQ